jgi:hypothetical protein
VVHWLLGDVLPHAASPAATAADDARMASLGDRDVEKEDLIIGRQYSNAHDFSFRVGRV